MAWSLPLSDTDDVSFSSDNYVIPTLASLVQARLGMRSVHASMLKGACASQIEALQMGAETLMAGSARTVLVVTSEGLLSNVMHVLDWRLSSLFGEGAAAFLLERSDEDSYIINGYNPGLGYVIRGQTPLRKDVIEMAEVDMKILQLFQQGKAHPFNTLKKAAPEEPDASASCTLRPAVPAYRRPWRPFGLCRHAPLQGPRPPRPTALAHELGYKLSRGKKLPRKMRGMCAVLSVSGRGV